MLVCVWGGENGVNGVNDQPRSAGHELSWTHITLAKKDSSPIFYYLLSDLESFPMKNSEYWGELFFISLVNSADVCLCVGFFYTPFGVLFKISTIFPAQYLNQSRKNPIVIASRVYGLPCARCWVGNRAGKGNEARVVL